MQNEPTCLVQKIEFQKIEIKKIHLQNFEILEKYIYWDQPGL